MLHLFERFYRKGRYGNGLIAIESVVVAGLGIGCGFLLFPAEASLIGVFLIAFGQADTVERLLDRNRDEVWGGKMRTSLANLRLALSLLTLFLCVMLSYSAATLLVPADRVLDLFGRQIGFFGGHSVADLDFGSVGSVLGNNVLVLIASFLLSLVYRHGGMMLVLAWNASVWGTVFPHIARTAPDLAASTPLPYFLGTMLCIGPHLLPEACAYVLAAMAGVFLSRGLQRHELGSDAMSRVGMAVLRITGLALLLLAAASVAESFLAPRLIGWIF